MFKRISISSSHTVYFTKVDYSREKDLREFLEQKNIDLNPLKSIPNVKRRIEWMSIREIITRIMPDKEDIVYNDVGKPFFKNSHNHLSISHSNEMIAISIDAKSETGIDVQFITEKVSRIKHKFLNEKEQNIASSEPLELTCYWSAKEALFKTYGKRDAFLKENIEIGKLVFNNTNGHAEGVVRADNYYSAHSIALKKVDNYILAYTLNS